MRFGIAGVVAMLLGGCPRADLVPCGDLACPADATCRAGACVPTVAIEACAEQPALAPCTADGVAGLCVDGVCTPVGCGNGVVDVGEVCDDGNTAAGDGCRADCRGVEACGDGFRDPGESCDCGADEASRPPNCVASNSDDPSAECDPSCGRFCGDGVVTGFEQCDGGELAGRTCASLGFYTGDLACAQCVFDATRCAETCGDGLVQPSGGEDCDSAPPAYGCVDLGADLGHLSCTARCTADVVGDCGRLGWQVIQLAQRVTTVWTDGTRTAMALDDRAVVRSGGAVASHDGNYAQIAADATGVWFVGFADTVRYEAGTWTTLPGVPETPGFDAAIMAAGVDTQGRLMVMRDLPCSVLVLESGGWVDTGISAGACFGGAVCQGDVIAAAGDQGGVTQWTGGAWVPVPVSGLIHQLAAIDGELWIAATGGLYRGSTLVDGSEFLKIAGGGGLVYAARAGSISRFGPDERIFIPDAAQVFGLAAPAGGEGPPIVSTATAVRELSHGIWITENPPSGVLQGGNLKVHRFPDGVVVVGQGVALSSTRGWLGDSIPTGLGLVWGRTRADFWAAGATGLYRFVAFPDTPAAAISGPWLTKPIVSIGGGPAGLPLIATSDAIYRDDGASSWTALPVPSGCIVRAVAGGPTGAEFVAGSCEIQSRGTLWELVGGAFVERYRSTMNNSPLVDLTVTSDGKVFAIGSSHSVRWDGTTAEIGALGGTRIAGLRSDDVWAISPTQDGSPPLAHWDGTTWARVRTADNASYLDVAVGESDDVIVVRTPAVQRLLRTSRP